MVSALFLFENEHTEFPIRIIYSDGEAENKLKDQQVSPAKALFADSGFGSVGKGTHRGA